MQFVTTTETGTSGIPAETIQAVEFANADEARELIHQLGNYACNEARKSHKGISHDAARAREVATRLNRQVDTGTITDAPFSFLLRNPDLRPGGFRSRSELRVVGGILNGLAWHHGIPKVASEHGRSERPDHS